MQRLRVIHAFERIFPFAMVFEINDVEYNTKKTAINIYNDFVSVKLSYVSRTVLNNA